jgi:predicted membrane channel-forming protein YqfA (hemolysin III family)
MSAARASGVEHLSRSLVPAIGFVVLALLWLFPLVGLVLTLAFLLAFFGTSRFVEGRVAIATVAAFALVAVMFELLQVAITSEALRLFLTALMFLLVGWKYFRRSDLGLPQWTWSTTIWFALVLGTFAVIYIPLWGAADVELLATLQIGWDHNAHFVFFAAEYLHNKLPH